MLTPGASLASIWNQHKHQLLHRLALDETITNLQYHFAKIKRLLLNIAIYKDLINFVYNLKLYTFKPQKSIKYLLYLIV